MDAIIASGYEMGGHAYAVPMNTIDLALKVIEVVDVPVLVSGAISDGRRLAAALAIGGAGVVLGIRFIAKVENH